MKEKEYITIPELAKILGLSRIAVFKKVKRRQIKAIRIGRNYAIPKKYVEGILGKTLSNADKEQIDKAVKKTVKEYGSTLRLLGRE
ncbi:MAG: helix-turn-helix domain-containing protein, partial [Candidatus Omnitrophica bacterium]|nr:helix-turn-helix domain-containing protein [Candidatus Omnitrophota bacterium]